jgi:glutathione S-transferase
MKIYQFDRSPFCIAIIQALRAGGFEPELVNVSNADRSEVIRLTNGAYYQVPVLVDEEKVIYETGPDSQDIATYVDTHWLKGKLFPKSAQGLQTILIQYIENSVESVTFKVCDAAILPAMEDIVERSMIIRHKERKFGAGCVDQWHRDRDKLIAEAERLLKPFEEMLINGHRNYLLADEPVYTDFVLFGILGNYTYKNVAELPPEYTGLRAWYDRVKKFRY